MKPRKNLHFPRKSMGNCWFISLINTWKTWARSRSWILTTCANACSQVVHRLYFRWLYGDTFAVGPDGSIYPCYRFIGMPEYVMGNVSDHPKKEDLAKSDAWKKMFQFKDYVDRNCKECSNIKFCRGGCPYNAMAPHNGEIKGVDHTVLLIRGYSRK